MKGVLWRANASLWVGWVVVGLGVWGCGGDESATGPHSIVFNNVDNVNNTRVLVTDPTGAQHSIALHLTPQPPATTTFKTTLKAGETFSFSASRGSASGSKACTVSEAGASGGRADVDIRPLNTTVNVNCAAGWQ